MHSSVSLGTLEETGKLTSSVDGFPELSRLWNNGRKKSSSAVLRAFLLIFSCTLRLGGEQTQLSYTLKQDLHTQKFCKNSKQ